MKRSKPLKRVPLRPGTSGLSRSSELARGPKRMKRGTPLRAKNPKTGGSRFPKRRDYPYCRWVRSLACVAEGHDCLGAVQAAHVCGKTRAAGAYDRGEVAPLCVKHHTEEQGRTARFNRKYRLNLARIAKRLGAEYTALLIAPAIATTIAKIFARRPVVSAPPREHR